MNVYVETNFVLELVLQQEQSTNCEDILRWCEDNKARLIIPAYSMAEPHETLFRQASRRNELQRMLNIEVNQLTRTASYSARISGMKM